MPRLRTPGDPPAAPVHPAFDVPASGFTGDATVLVRPLITSGFWESPPALTLVFLWDEQFGVRITDAASTSSRVALVSARDEFVGPAQALDDLARWTSLASERLGYMVGASRRSVYNWRHGARVSADTQARVAQIHRLLAPLSVRLAPATLRDWLDAGDPSPLQLAHAEDWPGLEQRVAAFTAPPTMARPVAPTDATTGGMEAFNAATRNAMLAAFTSGRDLAPRRPDWFPRELTGSGDEESDED